MLAKIYLDLPYTSEIPGAASQDAAGLMGGSGANLGNFAFRHALRFIVDDLDSYERMTWKDLHRTAKSEDVDHLVLSCANWLGLSDQDEAANTNRVRAIEASECRAVCFGLGVQAKLTDELPTLGPNTLRLATILSERSASVSVRDGLTRDVLAAAGLKNAVVTGCPSNFINPDPDLGKKVAGTARALITENPSWSDLRSCISEASGGHAYSGRVLKNHLEMLAEFPAFYLIQSPALLSFLLRESAEISPFYLRSSPFEEESGELEHTLRRSLLHFSSMDAWMDFARTCHISFGMRIHGTMVPLQSGVPSALIAHDTRTVGLARRMGIPWVTPEDFVNIYSKDPRPLLEHIADVMDSYDACRAEVGATMLEHVVANGLKPHPAFEALVTSTSAA
jgi:Polysaccharide pyruvyl transferase